MRSTPEIFGDVFGKEEGKRKKGGEESQSEDPQVTVRRTTPVPPEPEKEGSSPRSKRLLDLAPRVKGRKKKEREKEGGPLDSLSEPTLPRHKGTCAGKS